MAGVEQGVFEGLVQGECAWSALWFVPGVVLGEGS